MAYLAAAVVLLGLLCLVNLLFTLGIVRRMREPAPDWHTAPPFLLGPGSGIGEFAAVTTAGEPVSHETVAGMVGFFSIGCEACHELLPAFRERAAQLDRERVLAVVGGDDEDMVRSLEPVARVIVADPAGGPVAQAFKNTWTPALYLVGDDHRVAAAGTRMDELPAGVPVGG
jgi:hypothetical protein